MGISNYCANNFAPKSIEYVYALRCPINYDVFYIGKTVDLKTRLKAHISESKSERRRYFNKAKSDRIRFITENKMIPIMSVIDKTEKRIAIDEHHAAYKEYYWIGYYIKIGWNLTNLREIERDLTKTQFYYYLNTKNKRFRLSENLYYFGKDRLLKTK